MIPKFRAWSTDKKIMAEVRTLRFTDELVETDKFVERSIEGVELMQSTGLLDKNGKEIFEGDIIRTNVYGCIVYGCIVGFGEYTYFEDENSLTTEIGFYLSFLNVKPATYAPFDKYYWANCEVIGNIYENELDLIVYEAYKYNKSNEDK